MSGGVAEAVVELPYTFRYFRELSPSFLSVALLNQGIVFETGRPLRYLELGFGQGVSLTVHAAACDGEFWGNDFSPEHVAHAQGLASASGADSHLLVDSFVELAARDDLPEFDIIVLHGVWSWVSEQDRSAIIDLARRKLADGGLLYVSYNCTTGWGAALGFRELAKLYATHEVEDALPVVAKVDRALTFAQALQKAGASYFGAHPGVETMLQSFMEKDRAYVSHELFVPNFAIRSFAEVSSELREANLHFAASALLLTQEGILPQPGGELLSGLKSQVMREMARDAFANTRFREDIFIKGEPRILSSEQRMDRLRKWSFALTVPYGALPRAIHWHGQDVNLGTESNIEIVKALRAADYAPKSLADMEIALGRPLDQFLSSLMLLVGVGCVQPVQPVVDAEARARCSRLNAEVCSRARNAESVDALASPVLGAGLHLGRLNQLFLLAMSEGRRAPPEMVEFAWRRLEAESDGKIVPAAQSLTRANVEAAATGFAALFPILKALEIA
jgi:hypothetical protein